MCVCVYVNQKRWKYERERERERERESVCVRVCVLKWIKKGENNDVPISERERECVKRKWK